MDPAGYMWFSLGPTGKCRGYHWSCRDATDVSSAGTLRQRWLSLFHPVTLHFTSKESVEEWTQHCMS